MRLTDRTSLTTAALNDLMHIVDVSDKTDSDEGTSKKIRVDDMGFQLYSQRGIANGYTPLNSNVKIDTQYLPSYVDDVLEFTNRAAFPTTGEAGKIYIAKDSNFCYRWSGTVYVQVGGGGSGDVETVFGRMGNIVASQGDYKTSLITNNSNVSGTYLDDALDLLQGQINDREISFSKNTAFNKNFGTSSGTVLEGDWRPSWSQVTGKPTTISGYGITDAYTKGESNNNYVNSQGGLITTSVTNGRGQLEVRNTTNENGAMFRLITPSSEWRISNTYQTLSGYLAFRNTTTNTTALELSPTGNVYAREDLEVGNRLNIIGKLTPQSLVIQGNGVGDANTAFMAFYESNGTTRQGYFGFPSPTSSYMSIYNEVYGNQFRLTSGGVNGAQYLWGGGTETLWHTGNLRSNVDNDNRYVNVEGDETISGIKTFTTGTRSKPFNDFAVNTSDWSYVQFMRTNGRNDEFGTSLPPLMIWTPHTSSDASGNYGFGIGSQYGSDNNPILYHYYRNGDGTASFSKQVWTEVTRRSNSEDDARFASQTTTISAGTGLSGGGNLTANRTLSVDSTVARTNVAETFSSTVTANGFYESSDRRLKENIVPLNYGLKEIEKIDTHTWNWKSDGTEDMGVIAQELELIMPELVKTDEEGYKSVNYPKLIPVLINAIKELSNGKKY